MARNVKTPSKPVRLRGVYDHTGLRSERIKILRGDFWELKGGLSKVYNIVKPVMSLITAF